MVGQLWFVLRSLFLFVNCIAGALIALLITACTYPDPQEEIHFSAFVPTEEQMGLKTSMIPAPLSMVHLMPEANNPAGVRELLYGKVSLIANFNHDRAPPPSDPSLTDTQLQDLFDPFYVGSANIDNNQTDASCATTHDGEVGGILRFNNSWCTMGVIKIALHRAVTLYDNFHFIIVDIVQKLDESMNQKGVTLFFNNSTVKTLHSDGLVIRLYYDDCANHQRSTVTDQGAYVMCSSESANAVYHRAVIRPLSPTSNFVTPDSVIGKMEWIVRPNTEVSGKMAISNSLMTPDTYTAYAPQQMQFEFNSDSAGRFQSFVIKFAPQLLASGSVSREFAWAANVIRVSREPGSGGNPGHWVARGSIAYELAIGFNPIGPYVYDPFTMRNMRLYFVAVSEDVFARGKAVYKAILADGNVEGPLGLKNFAYPTGQLAGWDRDLHLWAAYKKMLKQIYTEDYYLIRRGMDGTGVKIWDAESGEMRTRGGTYQLRVQENDLRVLQGSTGRVVTKSDASGTTYAQIHLWQPSSDNFGGTHLNWVGSCEPFPATTTGLSSLAPNPDPNRSHQILIGKKNSSDSTYEARLVDVSLVVGNYGPCPLVASFQDATTRYPGIEYVDFSPDGNRVVAGNSFQSLVWNVATPGLPIRSIQNPGGHARILSSRFDNTGTQVFVGADNIANNIAGMSTLVIDIATGNWLHLHANDLSNYFFAQVAAFGLPGFDNQIAIVRPMVRNNFSALVTPAKVYRWDISQWNPADGNATWTTTTSANLLQTVDLKDKAGLELDVRNTGIRPVANQVAFVGVVRTEFTNLQALYYRLDRYTGEIEATPFWTDKIVGLDYASTDFSPDGNIFYFLAWKNNTIYNSYPRVGIQAWRLDNLTRAAPKFFGGGHTGAALDAVITPDQQNMLTLGEDGAVVIWNMFDGTVLHKFQVHTAAGTRLMLTHNGKVLATAGKDGRMNFLDIDTSSPSFGRVLYTIPIRTNTLGLEIEINWFDYDDHFGQHRIVTGENDGTVNVYSIASDASSSTLLKSFPNLMTKANTVDFSTDGTLILVAGEGIQIRNIFPIPWDEIKEMFVLSSDPRVTYGSRGPYNNLGVLDQVFAGYIVKAALFFPEDNSRILATNLWEGTKVIGLTLVPHPTDPINNPPTFTAVEQGVLPLDRSSTTVGDGVSIAKVGQRLHALVRRQGAYQENIQCGGNCPMLTHWDVTPNSTNFGKQFSLVDPTEVTSPYGQPRFQEGGTILPQLYSGAMTSDGRMVYSAGRGSLYSPSWVDFESWFGPAKDPSNVRPDEGETLNPYFVEHINSTLGPGACVQWDTAGICIAWDGSGACFQWDAAARNCVIPCSAPEIGGCSVYKITSQFTLNNSGAKPNPPAGFNRMMQILRDIENSSPSTAGYLTDDYLAQPIN